MISFRPVVREPGQSRCNGREVRPLWPGGVHTNSSELAAHVEDHDDGHGQGDDVYGARSHLEDDGVGQLDVAGIAVCLDADPAVYGGDGADGCAQGQRCRLAEGREVAERHPVGLALDRRGAPDRVGVAVAVALDTWGLGKNVLKAEGLINRPLWRDCPQFSILSSQFSSPSAFPETSLDRVPRQVLTARKRSNLCQLSAWYRRRASVIVESEVRARSRGPQWWK
jgi:hypothetical protein